MKLVFISLLFIPFYFLRLYQLPKYNIPENQTVKVVGRVTQQPYLKDSYQIIQLGPVLIKTTRFPGYFYGDKLQIVGKFQSKVLNPFQTQYFALFPTIQKTQNDSSLIEKTNLKRFLFKTRGQIERKIGEVLPEPHSSLLLGILFGVKSQMPENFWQNLRKTGTLHLVVASGQNVAMVAGFLIGGLSWFLTRRQGIIFTSLGIIGYVLMVGAEPPAVRAGIMTILAFVGQLFGREREGMGLLLVSAGIMLLVSPLILFDVGFQLSFAAMAGIILIYPKLKEWGRLGHHFSRLFSLPLLGEGLAVTISAQIATLPILLVNFGQFSLLSPLINTLVLPTIPLVMILGGVAAGLSLLSKSFGQVLTWFVWPFLVWFVKIVEWFGDLPWVSWEVGKLSGWWAVGYYFLLGVFLLRSPLRGDRLK